MIILDDFIRDDELLKDIATSGPLWEEGYHWWRGWWSTDASTIGHRLIEYIWRDNTPEQVSGLNISGFEHWTGIFSKDKVITNDDDMNRGYALNHHFDKDEAHWRETDEVISPLIGTIYYPPMGEQCEGGYLKIYKTKRLDNTVPYELVEPVGNRLVIFDAGQLHAITGISSGIRHSVAINLWEDQLSNEQRKEMTIA